MAAIKIKTASKVIPQCYAYTLPECPHMMAGQR